MKYKFLIAILFCNFCFSQSISGLIEYKIRLVESDFSTDEFMIDFYAEIKRNYTYLEFTLDFNENEMRFSGNNSMFIDKNQKQQLLMFCDAEGVFYKNKNEHYFLIDYNNDLYKQTLIKKIYKTDWKIFNETKTIAGFVCKKAICDLFVNNGDGDIHKINSLIVWYCPEIKYPYGPLTYGGLNGLILEVEKRGVIIYATRIDLKSIAKNIKPSQDKKVIFENDFTFTTSEN